RRRRRATRRPLGSRALAGAQLSLRSFRQASIVAVAATGLILTLLGETAEALPQVETGAAGTAAEAPPPFEPVEPRSPEAREVARATSEQARGVVAGLSERFVRGLPRLLVALAALIA